MVRLDRRRVVVSVIFLSLGMGLTGCLNTSSEPPVFGPNAMSPSPLRNGLYQPNQQGNMAANGVRQASFTGQVMPGQAEDIMMDPNMSGGMGMMPGMNPPMPGELKMVTHAPHRVAAPDVLLIEALRLVPKGPYRLEPMEVLQIEASTCCPNKTSKAST